MTRQAEETAQDNVSEFCESDRDISGAKNWRSLQAIRVEGYTTVKSKVLELVPGASSAQIGAFLRLAESTVKMQEEVQRKSAEALKKDAIPVEQESISLLGSLKELGVENQEDAPKLECPTDPKSEFM